jgi:hypothetical protein
MAVPAPGQGCGVVFALVFVGGCGGGFIALAVDNLIHFKSTPLYGLVPSVFWLGIVAFVIVVLLCTIGVREMAVAFLGEFSPRHFVEAGRDGDRTVIGFGFRLFGIRLYYLRLDREQVVSVDMRTGQASAFAGRDMNDWHVALWYRDFGKPARFFQGRRIDEVYLVGPAQARAVTEPWFREFVGFLRAAGVALVPGEQETEYRIPDPGPPDHAPAPPPA